MLAVGSGSGAPLLFADGVAAGFPSPAQDYQEDVIDLNRELVLHPASTFCVRVRGDSMRDAGVANGDILVVDRSLPATEGCIAVCILDGDFTVKRFHQSRGRVELRPANPDYRPIEVGPGQSFEVWGVVAWTLHRHLGR